MMKGIILHEQYYQRKKIYKRKIKREKKENTLSTKKKRFKKEKERKQDLDKLQKKKLRSYCFSFINSHLRRQRMKCKFVSLTRTLMNTEWMEQMDKTWMLHY